MKRIVVLILMAMMLVGCASTKASKPEPVSTDPREEALKRGIRSLTQAVEDQKDGNEAKALKEFGDALKQLNSLDDESSAVMTAASEKLRKVVEISGFEYAPKDAFNLLITYLEMQNATRNSDMSLLRSLDIRFNAAYQGTQQKTAEEKQKRLEALGSEVVQKRDEIQKQAEPALLESYPAIYVVKKGDTLPSIAARHEVYNDSFMWPLIYKANRDQIKNPTVLYAGQDLKIPREMGTDEIVEARREAGAPDPEKIPKDAYMPRGKKK